MSGGQGIQSIADLTSQTRITTGDIPPPLVGTSTTVVGTKLYLFGGRLVSSRRMTNDLYVLDLDTYHWTKQVPPPDSEKPPKSRYFHSANAYKNQLVIFGGMGHSRSSADGLCVLDDVSILDLDTMNWIIPEIIPSLYTPRPRYAHLASVTGNKLVVIGGQDMSNLYIAEINVLDMDQWTWTSSRPFEKHCGAYRSVAVSSSTGSSIPLFGVNQTTDYSAMGGDLLSSTTAPEPFRRSSSNVSNLASNGSIRRSTSPNVANPNIQRGGGPGRSTLSRTNSVYRLSYTLQTTEDNPNPIYLYSNYNFTDVKRELQLIFPPNISNIKIDDHSNDMSGNILPPGLRFPSGHILGHNLILAGTYLTPQSQTFSMWVLNLASLVWSRIETGTVFQVGSWNRGVLCEANNKFIVLGHRDRSLLEDYNHRQANFDHVAIVDMEAFGVYQPPAATFPPLAQDMGLSLLNEPNISDFDVQTSDGKTIMVNSSILSSRWPYFRELMRINYENVEVEAGDITERKDGDNTLSLPSDDKGRKIVQISPKDRTLIFAEPYPIVFAFLQFIYTDHLLTADQHQPHILSQLLLIADMYDLPRLRDLATHALHQMLNMSTAALIYETAALSNQTGLQIRALKVMIAAKKMMQQQQQRAAAAPGNGANPNGSQFRGPPGNGSVTGGSFSEAGSESGYFPSGASQLGSTWGNSEDGNYNPMGSAFSGYHGAQSPGPRPIYGSEDGSRMSMYESQAYQPAQNFNLQQTPIRTRQPSAFSTHSTISTQSRPSYSGSAVYPSSQTSSGSSARNNSMSQAPQTKSGRSGSVSSDGAKSNNSDGKNKKKKQVDPDQLVKAFSGMDKSPLSNYSNGVTPRS